MKKNAPPKLLTELELEIMNGVWTKHPCTVREVLESVSKNKPLAYTSIATMLKILEQKGFLESKKTELTLLYFPLVSKSDYESKTLKHLTQKLFNGDPESMVMRLLDDKSLTPESIARIRELLDGKAES